MFGVVVSCHILYSIVSYLYVSCSGSITSGDDLKTSLRLSVRSWILCIFCFHICVFVAIKIKFKPITSVGELN